MAPPPVAVTIPDHAYDVGGSADGGLLVATVGATSAQLSRIPPGTVARTPPVTLVPHVKASATWPVIERDGQMVVVAVVGPRTAHRTLMRDFDAAGSPTGPIRSVPGYTPTDFPSDIVAGPTGALAILSDTTTDDRGRPRLAFRPAGKVIFNPVVKIGPNQTAAEVFRDGVIATKRTVCLGQDGGGALLTVPGGRPAHQPVPYVQRLSPQGKLGPAIPIRLPRRSSANGKVAIGPDGTVSMAFVTSRDGRTQVLSEQMWATSLAPGATQVTPLQPLGSLDHPKRGWQFELTAAGSAQPSLVRWDGVGAQVFDGPPTALTQTATLDRAFANGASAAMSPDGGETILASVSNERGWSIIESHRPPGGTFGAPRAVVSSADGSDDLFIDPPRPLPGGDVAFSYAARTLNGSGRRLVRFTP